MGNAPGQNRIPTAPRKLQYLKEDDDPDLGSSMLPSALQLLGHFSRTILDLALLCQCVGLLT